MQSARLLLPSPSTSPTVPTVRLFRNGHRRSPLRWRRHVSFPGDSATNALCLLVKHCLFFQSNTFGSVLCTGDFRFESDILDSVWKKYASVPIDRLFLDTTNWNVRQRNFPSRSETVRNMCEIVSQRPNWDFALACPQVDTVVMIFQSMYMYLHVRFCALYRFTWAAKRCWLSWRKHWAKRLPSMKNGWRCCEFWASISILSQGIRTIIAKLLV